MSITLSETAAREIKAVIEQQHESARTSGDEPKPMYLRLGVKGGGCSGFSYSLDLTETGLDRVVRAGYALLNLITFLTAGPKEVRAWTVEKGATAQEAAGAIHTDFAKGFIAAETIAYDDYITLGGEQAAKEAGKMRAEGREYIVKDGDVLLFRFNV